MNCLQVLDQADGGADPDSADVGRSRACARLAYRKRGPTHTSHVDSVVQSQAKRPARVYLGGESQYSFAQQRT
jgi:hypothetical protein